MAEYNIIELANEVKELTDTMNNWLHDELDISGAKLKLYQPVEFRSYDEYDNEKDARIGIAALIEDTYNRIRAYYYLTPDIDIREFNGINVNIATYFVYKKVLFWKKTIRRYTVFINAELLVKPSKEWKQTYKEMKNIQSSLTEENK